MRPIVLTLFFVAFVGSILLALAGTPSESCCHELSERMETVERHIDAAWDKEGKYRFGQLEGAQTDQEFMVVLRRRVKALERKVKELEGK